MKIKKINKEFLDLYYKNKLIAYELDEDKGKVLLTDSYRLYILNIEDFILKYDILTPATLHTFLDDSGYFDGIITNEIYKEQYNLRLITGKDKLIHIKVNDKYLELFDNPSVKIKDEKSPVLIYENNELVGLILPIINY